MRLKKNSKKVFGLVKMNSSGNLETFFTTRNVLYFLSAPILIVGGLNWLATGIQNLRKKDTATKTDDLLNALGLPSIIVNIIYIIVGIAALGLLAVMFMDVFGPPEMLNTAFFPSTLIVAERAPDNADAATKIRVTPFAKLAYWAAQPPITPGMVYDNELVAYGPFINAGVAIADANGDAVLRFRRPAGYKVRGVTLQPHLHYRVATGTDVSTNFDGEIWGPVETTYEFQSFARE